MSEEVVVEVVEPEDEPEVLADFSFEYSCPTVTTTPHVFSDGLGDDLIMVEALVSGSDPRFPSVTYDIMDNIAKYGMSRERLTALLVEILKAG